MTSLDISLNVYSKNLMQALPSKSIKFTDFTLKSAVYNFITIIASVCPETQKLTLKFNDYHTEIEVYLVDWRFSKPEIHVCIPNGFMKHLSVALTSNQIQCVLTTVLKKFFHDQFNYISTNHGITATGDKAKIPFYMDFSQLHPAHRKDGAKHKEDNIDKAKRCRPYQNSEFLKRDMPKTVTGWADKVFTTISEEQFAQHFKNSEKLENFKHYALKEQCIITNDGDILHVCRYCTENKNKRFMLHIPYLVCTGCYSHEPLCIPQEMIPFLSFNWRNVDPVHGEKTVSRSCPTYKRPHATIPRECQETDKLQMRLSDSAINFVLKKTHTDQGTQTDVGLPELFELQIIESDMASTSGTSHEKRDVKKSGKKLAPGHRHSKAIKKLKTAHNA